MVIQNKTFPDGELIIYTDYSRSTHAGADGYFQVVDICISNDSEDSILDELNVDQGVHYQCIEALLKDLLVSPNFVNYKEVIANN